MARNYEVSVTGLNTHGEFELFCAPQDGGPVWCTGPMSVSVTPAQLIDRLMPGMDARVAMGTFRDIDGQVKPYPADRDHGPKSWFITLEGQLYAGVGHYSGGARLTGGNGSAGLIVLDLGHVPDRRPGAGLETPATKGAGLGR